MDPIVVILGVIGFIAVSVIQNILEKKLRRDQPPSEPPTEPAVPRSLSPEAWQEYMRRILQPESPPVITPPPVHKPQPAPLIKPVLIESAEGDFHLPSPLKESAAAYGRAAHLHEKVEARMNQVVQQTATHKKSVLTAHESAGSRAVALVKNPATVRQAVVASIILGAPKAFEERTL